MEGRFNRVPRVSRLRSGVSTVLAAAFAMALLFLSVVGFVRVVVEGVR